MQSGGTSSRSGHVAELGRQRGRRGTLLGGSCPEPPRPVPAREKPPCPSSSQGPDRQHPLGLVSSGALEHASLSGVPGLDWEMGPPQPHACPAHCSGSSSGTRGPGRGQPRPRDWRGLGPPSPHQGGKSQRPEGKGPAGQGQVWGSGWTPGGRVLTESPRVRRGPPWAAEAWIPVRPLPALSSCLKMEKKAGSQAWGSWRPALQSQRLQHTDPRDRKSVV